MNKLKLFLPLLMLLCFTVGNVWADVITLTYEDVTTTSYSTTEQNFTDGVQFGYTNLMRNGSNGTPSGWAKDQVLQSKNGSLYNNAAISTISNIRVYLVVNTNTFTLAYGTTNECNAGSITRPTTATGSANITYSSYANKTVTSGQSTTASYYDFNLSTASPTFFKITTGSNAVYIHKIEITYSSTSGGSGGGSDQPSL